MSPLTKGEAVPDLQRLLRALPPELPVRVATIRFSPPNPFRKTPALQTSVDADNEPKLGPLPDLAAYLLPVITVANGGAVVTVESPRPRGSMAVDNT